MCLTFDEPFKIFYISSSDFQVLSTVSQTSSIEVINFSFILNESNIGVSCFVLS
jgi:hypothetical protein